MAEFMNAAGQLELEVGVSRGGEGGGVVGGASNGGGRRRAGRRSWRDGGRASTVEATDACESRHTGVTRLNLL